MPKRNRRLSDAELFAFWRATGRMKYPVGPVYRMLLLTGLRLNEAAQLSWPEVQGDIIVIPPERMKAKDGKAVEHLVPCHGGDQEVIASLPRIKGGKYLFSLSGGQASTGDDRPDQARSGPAHAADAQGDGPPSRRGSSRRRVAAMGQPRSAPHGALWIVGACASRTTSPKPCLRTARAASPPPMTCMNIRTRRREALEQWAQRIASIVNPGLPRPPRSSSCGGGGDDRATRVTICEGGALLPARPR